MNVEIELTQEIVERFIQEDMPSAVQDLPFRDFYIRFPYKVFQSAKQLTEVAMQSYNDRPMDAIEYGKLQLFANRFVEGLVSLRVSEFNHYYDISLSTPNIEVNGRITGEVAFSYTLHKILPVFPAIKENTLVPSDGKHLDLALKLNKIIRAVSDHFNSPTIIKEKNNVKTLDDNKYTKTNQTKPKATYVYRTRYKFKNVDTVVQDKRNYVRLQDAWEVRGHYRHYKSGKTVWVDGYTKGDPSKMKAETKKYKITRM